MLRRIGLIAAGLLLIALTGLVALPAAYSSAPTATHTCSATDRQFLKTAEMNIAALGVWGDEYVRGEASAAEVVTESRNAERVVDKTSPRDPSLKKTRTLMRAMFNEYGKAISAKAKGRDAGPHIFRAYGLANFARDVLVEAQPGLAARGCDVAPLL